MIQRYDSMQQFDDGGPWVKHADHLAELARVVTEPRPLRVTWDAIATAVALMAWLVGK